MATVHQNVLARVMRAKEALDDGETDLARAILDDLEHDLAMARLERPLDLEEAA